MQILQGFGCRTRFFTTRITESDNKNALEFEKIRAELEGVKELVKLIIGRIDDPYTNEKFEKYSKDPEKMLRLIGNNRV